MPVGSQWVYCVSCMHARRARARPSWHGRQWHAHGYMSFRTTTIHARARTHARTHTRYGYVGIRVVRALHPVSRLSSPWRQERRFERAREREKNEENERKATSNGKQTKKKRAEWDSGCGIWGDCRISESADPQETPFRVTENISPFFSTFSFGRIYLRLQMRWIGMHADRIWLNSIEWRFRNDSTDCHCSVFVHVEYDSLKTILTFLKLT